MNEEQALARVKEADEQLEVLRAFTVQTPEQYAMADEALAELKSQKKASTDLRAEVLRPFKEGIKKLEARYRPVLDKLDTGIQILTQAMLDYKAWEEDRRQEQLAVVADAETPEEIEAAMVAAGTVAESSANTIVETWKARVVDFTLLPDEYKVANTVALNKLAKTEGVKNGSTKIEGVEFYAEKSFRKSTKKKF